MSSLLLNIHNQRKLQFTFHRSLWHVNHTREAQRADQITDIKRISWICTYLLNFPAESSCSSFFGNVHYSVPHGKATAELQIRRKLVYNNIKSNRAHLCPFPIKCTHVPKFVKKNLTSFLSLSHNIPLILLHFRITFMRNEP